MSNKIVMTFAEPFGVIDVATDSWLVTPRTWLQRLCWRFLMHRRACARYMRQDQVVRQVVIDPDKLASGIIMESRGRLDRIAGSGRQTAQVFMGPKDYARLMSEPEIGRYINANFSVCASARYSDGYMHDKIFGISVTVVTHMEGILVV